MTSSRGLIVLSIGLAGLAAAAVPAAAQENVVGAEAYTQSCAVCHGSDGKGGGEFSGVLTVKPPNLTELSKSNDGVFPYLDVFHIVDGRTEVAAHGTRAMPIWGSTFKRDIGESAGPYGAELLVRAKIVALVDYIESLQQE